MLRSPNLLQLFSKHCTNPLVTLAVYLCKSTVVLLRFFFPKCFSLHTTLKTAQNSNFQVLLSHLILGEAVCFYIKLQSVRQKGERFSNFSLLALSPKGKCSSYRTIWELCNICKISYSQCDVWNFINTDWAEYGWISRDNWSLLSELFGVGFFVGFGLVF